MAHALAAFLAIPYGLSVMMRGSDGFNRGRYRPREAGLLIASGGGTILTALAMLIGFRYIGVLTIVALMAIATLRLQERRRRQGSRVGSNLVPAFGFAALISLLIIAGM